MASKQAESQKTIAIIQARTSSSRLPNKVLLDIAGQPMLAHVVERTRRAKRVDQVVVATTSEPVDDAIAALCAARHYPCYRGSLHDVLDRYYQAACAFQADVIVRITADCPTIDPQVIDHTINAFFGQPEQSKLQPPSSEPLWDFAANRLPPPWKRTYPIGLDTEVCSFAALECAWREADRPHQREHVMPYLYENSPVFDSLNLPAEPVNLPPGQFRVLLVNHDPDYGSLRWTVDTPEDLELVRLIFDRFGGRNDFSWLDILALYQREPELAHINLGIKHKTAFDTDAQYNKRPG